MASGSSDPSDGYDEEGKPVPGICSLAEDGDGSLVRVSRVVADSSDSGQATKAED